MSSLFIRVLRLSVLRFRTSCYGNGWRKNSAETFVTAGRHQSTCPSPRKEGIGRMEGELGKFYGMMGGCVACSAVRMWKGEGGRGTVHDG